MIVQSPLNGYSKSTMERTCCATAWKHGSSWFFRVKVFPTDNSFLSWAPWTCAIVSAFSRILSVNPFRLNMPLKQGTSQASGKNHALQDTTTSTCRCNPSSSGYAFVFVGWKTAQCSRKVKFTDLLHACEGRESVGPVSPSPSW